MSLAKLSSKGQLVLPKEIRNAINANTGTVFRITVHDNKVLLEPIEKSLLNRLHGKYSGTPLTKDLEEEHAREILAEKSS